MINNNLLEKFGHLLMTEVRDETLEKYEMISSGKLKSSIALELHNKLSTLDQEQLSVVMGIVMSSIDDTIHNFLWMFEQYEDIVQVICHEDEITANLNDISDGLSGELYTDDGWITRFSKYN